jgi:hypothetical protein
MPGVMGHITHYRSYTRMGEEAIEPSRDQPVQMREGERWLAGRETSTLIDREGVSDRHLSGGVVGWCVGRACGFGIWTWPHGLLLAQ